MGLPPNAVRGARYDDRLPIEWASHKHLRTDDLIRVPFIGVKEAARVRQMTVWRAGSLDGLHRDPRQVAAATKQTIVLGGADGSCLTRWSSCRVLSAVQRVAYNTLVLTQRIISAAALLRLARAQARLPVSGTATQSMNNAVSSGGQNTTQMCLPHNLKM